MSIASIHLSAISPVYIPPPDAEAASSLCYRTLKRHHQSGEPVGLVKIGRAVRFHKATLLKWLDARAGVCPAA